jgi:hypothetical protein
MSKLTAIIGQSVYMRSQILDENKPVLVKILGVEVGGIWIEWQQKTEEILAALQLSSASKTPIFFLPYAHIQWINALLDSPALSEKAFGVGDSDPPPKD